MKGQFPPIPEGCQRALAEIEGDPLQLSAAVEAHVDGCPSCAETRIAWLALQETEAVAPAGYFERLPDRILSKLPAGPRRRRPHLALWAMAAAPAPVRSQSSQNSVGNHGGKSQVEQA